MDLRVEYGIVLFRFVPALVWRNKNLRVFAFAVDLKFRNMRKPPRPKLAVLWAVYLAAFAAFWPVYLAALAVLWAPYPTATLALL
jgi:hypothetical protein